MKILIAPDSFKDCLPAREVATAIETGIQRVLPRAKCILLPMADGGEGTVDAILAARGGKRIKSVVTGPIGGKVTATYGLLDRPRTAVIETAAASGLMLVEPERRNPLLTCSYGTGALLADAIALGVREVILGLGGSATVDGGAGMAQALGFRFRDQEGKVIRQRAAGGMLERIASIDIDNVNPGLASVKITAATDVENKLCGRSGAAAVYGPQKGATPAMVKALDKNLRHLAGVIKRDLQVDVLKLKGGGAAGGLGAGMVAFAGAKLTNGVELVADLVDLDKNARGVDVIITGEGRIDTQTRHGKVVAGVAAMGNRLGIPVVAIGGSLADGLGDPSELGLAAVTSTIVRDMELDEAILHAREYIANAAERMLRLMLLGRKMKE